MREGHFPGLVFYLDATLIMYLGYQVLFRDQNFSSGKCSNQDKSRYFFVSCLSKCTLETFYI